jgi:hypothetical protein
LQVEQKEKPTPTYIFGTKLLLTFGVEILGKKLDDKIFVSFKTIDELISAKNAMPLPRSSNNIPIRIEKSNTKIEISGRLYKSGGLSHDPNIGALSIISAVLRKLDWSGKIEITKHGLSQNHVGKTNKFIQIANLLDISLQGLKIPTVEINEKYWKYEWLGEKLGTIFIHLVVEDFANGHSIFENHAGCEKSYFIPLDGDPIPLAKYTDKDKYKAGNKSQIVNIPDLVLLDLSNKIAVDVEGKKYEYRTKGIKELATYDAFDNFYTKKHYPEYSIIRTVVLYGSEKEQVIEFEVGFLLNENGKLILGIKAPKLFQEAIKNLLDFWKK